MPTGFACSPRPTKARPVATSSRRIAKRCLSCLEHREIIAVSCGMGTLPVYQSGISMLACHWTGCGHTYLDLPGEFVCVLKPLDSLGMTNLRNGLFQDRHELMSRHAQLKNPASLRNYGQIPWNVMRS